MVTRKVSLSLPEELLADADRAVREGRARSVSAYIAAAVRSGTPRRTTAEVLARWEREHGAGTPEERAAAEQRARAMFDRADERVNRREHGAA